MFLHLDWAYLTFWFSGLLLKVKQKCCECFIMHHLHKNLEKGYIKGNYSRSHMMHNFLLRRNKKSWLQIIKDKIFCISILKLSYITKKRISFCKNKFWECVVSKEPALEKRSEIATEQNRLSFYIKYLNYKGVVE